MSVLAFIFSAKEFVESLDCQVFEVISLPKWSQSHYLHLHRNLCAIPGESTCPTSSAASVSAANRFHRHLGRWGLLQSNQGLLVGYSVGWCCPFVSLNLN